MSHLHKIRVGHAYDGRVRGYGARVLVDRLWSRGLSTVKADLDEWCKTVAPSVELRTWYGHDPELFEQFRERYRTELDEPERIEALRHLQALAQECLHVGQRAFGQHAARRHTAQPPVNTRRLVGQRAQLPGAANSQVGLGHIDPDERRIRLRGRLLCPHAVKRGGEHNPP